MRRLKRRLQRLERLISCPGGLVEQIRQQALESLTTEELELLWEIHDQQKDATDVSSLSDREAPAYEACRVALEKEARSAGFRCYAEAEPAAVWRAGT